MSVLRLNENPILFDEAVNLYHQYLLDPGVPGFECELTSSEVKSQVQISLYGGRDYFLETTSGNNCVGITFGEPSGEYERLYETGGLYVTPEYRRQGIGLKLKEEKIDFIRGQGTFDWIYSKIHKSNKGSVELHKKLGFRVISDKQSEWNMAGLELT